MEIVLYNKKKTQPQKYINGEVKDKALKFAKLFYKIHNKNLKFIISVDHLFNLFIRTFNPYYPENNYPEISNIDDMIDAANMFDDILIALSSSNGLNICNVYINLEISPVDNTLFIPKKYVSWLL